MAMSLCVRALRLTRAARPLLSCRALTRTVHTAPRPPSASSTITHSHPEGLEHLKPEGDHEEEVNMYLKNPDTFGFSDDPKVDLWNARLVFFFGITLSLVLGSAFVHYMPDQHDWTRREAERLVKLREAQGLPLIPENYYDPNNLVLPDDDE